MSKIFEDSSHGIKAKVETWENNIGGNRQPGSRCTSGRKKFGDEGANTLANISRVLSGLYLPNFEKFGLGCIIDVKGMKRISETSGCYGKMAEKSAGKDTISGHWEIAGCSKSKPFPTYPRGFPDDVISEFEEKTGMIVIGNKAASGTEIIKELGEYHVKTGKPIVYTSADSVFQVATHKDIIPVDRLYQVCEITWRILKGEHSVGRVIARPFTGEYPNYKRTRERRDYGLPPEGETVLDILQERKICW